MLDLILLACLVLGVPARAIWLGRRPADKVGDHRSITYLKTIALALLLMGLLTADWIAGRRSPDMLGLGLPLSRAGSVGMALAAAVLAGLAGAMAADLRRKKAAKSADLAALLPATPREFMLFVALSVIIGPAWEVLYRGFLIWELTPRIGTLGALAVASAAYAAAHGVKSRQKLLASLVAALAFTTGYVLTGSLWWLMVIHTGLPILAAAFQLRRSSASATPELVTPGG